MEWKHLFYKEKNDREGQGKDLVNQKLEMSEEIPATIGDATRSDETLGNQRDIQQISPLKFSHVTILGNQCLKILRLEKFTK